MNRSRFDADEAARLRAMHGWSAPSPADYAMVEEALGRRPRAIWAVCTRCACGRPNVVANAPFALDAASDNWDGEEIFPTLFWLCCRDLYARIGRLEAAGGVVQAHQWLAERPGEQTALAAAHARCARLRASLVPADTRAWLAEHAPGLYAVLTQTGVAGIRGGGIKCLHAHVADHLALGGNPVGAWALRAVGEGCGCLESRGAGPCRCAASRR